MKFFLSLVFLGLVRASCVLAQSTEFITYRKDDPAQQQQIIIGDPLGQSVDYKNFPLPIFFGFPIRPYHIFGTVIAHGTLQADEAVPRPEVIQSLAAAAKAHQAAAIIMLRLTDEDRNAKSPAGQPWIIAKALAVTWQMDGPSKPRKPRS